MAHVDSPLRHRVPWQWVCVVVRAVLALLLMWFSLPASALLQPTTSTPIVRWTYSNNAENWYTDALSSCRGTTRPTYTTGNTTGTANHQSTTCLDSIYAAGSSRQLFICPSTGGGSRFGYAVAPSETSCGSPACPANSSAVSGGCQCNAGYNESGSACVQNQCAAQTGKTGIISWTEGYTLTPDEGDRKTVGGYNAPPANGEVCQAGCTVSAQTSGPGVEYFVSQQPTAQGLYRRSADFPTVGLGTPCTASDSAANSPVAPEPQCPGTVGQVGNKTACLSTPSKPVPTTDAPAPSKPPIAGNPPAGAKPDSGQASGNGSAGRTPDAGTGGNAGGSASAAVGGKGGGAGGTAAGTGTGTGAGAGSSNSGGRVTNPGDGTEQAACGAPGQPVCAVKVDETGMPGLGTTFKAATDKVNENFDSTSEAIKQIRDGESKPSWSFTFRLPTGCTSYAPAGFDDFAVSINPCAWQSTIHDLMSMVWAAATAFCLIGMVGRTFRST